MSEQHLFNNRQYRIRVLLQRTDYHFRELQFGKELCRQSSAAPMQSIDHEYDTSINDCMSLLQGHLEKIRKTVEELGEVEGSFARAYELAEHRLLRVTETIHTLLVSSLQRQPKPIRYFSSAHFSTYSWAEAHPAYATEIAILEAVSSHYFQVVRRLGTAFNLNAPLICFSDTDHCYVYFISDVLGPSLESIHKKLWKDAQLESFQGAVKDDFAQSLIVLPRWSGLHLRFAPFLAHECFHYLLRLVKLCCSYAEEMREEGADDEDWILKNCSDRFGKGIAALSRAYANMRKSFVEFVKSLEGVNRNGGTSISRHLDEILCDLGGVLLAGPCYAHAFAADCTLDRNTTHYDFTITHPPESIRIKFLDHFLRFCGYGDTADRVTSSMPVAFDRYDAQSLNIYHHYVEWFETNARDFELFVKLFGALLPELVEDSASLNRNSKSILKTVISGDIPRGHDNPFDILNAMWYKITFHQELPECGMQWRLALKNYRVHQETMGDENDKHEHLRRNSNQVRFTKSER